MVWLGIVLVAVGGAVATSAAYSDNEPIHVAHEKGKVLVGAFGGMMLGFLCAIYGLMT